ncbi:hypothetical protein GYMLUDRAFT_48683 [Collybiopsis luxurians FD-317 M1]|uniref:ABC transporter domain-containing protein n=1 Tax=Collybiopsis luxurians FD-317 M1 TaxID=944289 RepID=A0A0D0AVN1_9AGAR|nr:hypothetical protein GYMLUDRAFT_48683 [Collybiopsis luxurians FD-317 M1]
MTATNDIAAVNTKIGRGWDIQDQHEEKISFTDVAPVDILMRQVSVDVAVPKGFAELFSLRRSSDVESANPKTKRILDRISADFPRGSLCAIMGGSGSGKTTLLNILSHRMRGSAMVLSGSVLYNDSPALSSVTSSYVTQMDMLLPSLTVRETLLYAAALRLPSTTTDRERRNLVEEIILELGLKDCTNTHVGDGASHRGCSGGERRRVSIGVQMLSNPSVLFLDEPTTGLDATSAYQLIKMLKSLSFKGRTIICTIHQPRHDIFFLFDRITLLSQGSAVYSGPTNESASWFEGLVPGSYSEHLNPADYLIGVAAVDNRTAEAELKTRNQLTGLVEAWLKESLVRFPAHPSDTSGRKQVEQPVKVVRSAGVWRQIRVLTSRTIRTTIRDPMGLTASWMEAVTMGLVCGLIFLNLPKTLAGIRSREAALYIACALQGYLILLYDIYRLTGPSLSLFDREHSERVVGVIPWVVSTRLARLLLEDVIVPLLFSVIYYFMCGFDANAGQFFRFCAVVLLNQFIAVSLAMVCSAISRDFAIATLIANLMFTFQSFSCGFFIQAATIPVYVRWIKWVAYCFYGFAALVANEFSNKFYDCPVSGDSATNSDCIQYNGNFILQNLSFHPHWYTVPVCALVVFVVLFNLMAIVLLQFWTVDVQIAGIHVSKDNDEDSKRYQDVSALKQKGRDKAVTIDVDLVDMALTIEKTFLLNGFKKVQLPILHGVTTRFEAGSANVIMGPSGSGKSSLLNLMALRLKSTLFTQYQSSGSLLLNGFQPTESQLRSLCSYVTQDDNSLLPYLTVREMLRFAAGLRLPSNMSAKQKDNRAEEVIRMMGLSDCADCLIGSEILKGISGGEKRRVSIAVQVLTEPRILIADEPTSGLDAFTASSILDVLSGFAAEGRTVIITIHQSRSELFHQFGNLLLLAKGGRVAYSGKASSMIAYFGHLGYQCPSNCNPSDWALDLVSVDLRDSKAEEASRAKVEEILEAYEPKTSIALGLESNEKQAFRSLPSDLISLKKKPAPFHVAFPILIRRGLINFKRQPNLAIARIGQVLGLGLVEALFFAPLKRDYIAASVNIVGAIQEILPLYFVGMLQNVALYPIERDVFYKEHDDGAYSVEAFFAVYVCLEVPFEILSGLLYSLLADIAINLPRTIPMYFIIALNCFCIVSCGESLGIIFNTLFKSTGFALNVTSVILSVGTFMGGLMSIGMIGFLQGINYISPLKYATANMLPYALRGMTFTCDDSQKLANGQCPLTTGEQVLDLYKLNVDPAPMLGALVGTTIVYRIAAYMILRLVRTDFSVAKRR